ncbi:MAG: hypothetical protein ACXV5Q_16900 [Frankiaceae bacterium]
MPANEFGQAVPPSCRTAPFTVVVAMFSSGADGSAPLDVLAPDLPVR